METPKQPHSGRAYVKVIGSGDRCYVVVAVPGSGVHKRGPMFEDEAKRSHRLQKEIEAADSISFDEYLRRYFAQSAVERERLLG